MRKEHSKLPSTVSWMETELEGDSIPTAAKFCFPDRVAIAFVGAEGIPPRSTVDVVTAVPIDG